MPEQPHLRSCPGRRLAPPALTRAASRDLSWGLAGSHRMNRYNSDADDFYVNVNLNTEMELPSSRDTVLHYFEQMKKAFPDLCNFYTKDNGDLVLEGDKD